MNGMSTRRAKQIIYGTFYGLIWLAVLAGIYYIFIKPALTPPPCTGPACGSASAQPLATSTVWTFSAGPQSDTYLAQVTNLNANFGASGFDYNFDFENASGSVVETIPGSSIIYPNQIKYIVAPNEQPVAEPNLSLDLSNVQWVQSSSIGSVPQFAFENIETQTNSSTVSISGQVTNNDIAAFGEVLIVAVFKDASGNPIGASQTEIDNFAANSTQSFSVIYPAAPGINPANNELEAYALRTSL
jgi:hypothetical protein